MLDRVRTLAGHESLRVTQAGVNLLAVTLARNRAAFSAHEALVEQVAREMGRGGRIVWRGLSLRARIACDDPQRSLQWCIARPDVFSIRNTSIEAYAQPVVHEVKVRRADLLADLKQAGKRASYLDLGDCWYVLGCDSRGRCIGAADEVPPECGVLVVEAGRLQVARAAPGRPRHGLPFGTWMALAKAAPVAGLDEGVQQLLTDCGDAPVSDETGPTS